MAYSTLKMRGDMFLQNIGDFQQTIQCYIPENRTLHNHCCENLKPYMPKILNIKTTILPLVF
jgi:hypothetical protein